MRSLICPDCSEENSSSAMHCSKCGASLKNAKSIQGMSFGIPDSSNEAQPQSLALPPIKMYSFSVTELFSKGWEIYSNKFKEIAVIILCTYLPFNIISAFVPMESWINQAEINPFVLPMGVLFLFMELTVFIATTISIAKTTEMDIEGFDMPWRDAILFGFSKLSLSLITGLLFLIITTGLSLLLAIPGIIYIFYYYFWLYVVALRDKSGKSALDYSKRLVEGQWWKVLYTQVIIQIAARAVGLIISVVFGALMEVPFLEIIPITLMNIVGALFTVVTAVFFLNSDYLKKKEFIDSEISIAN